jgi:hypothetical protein
MKEMESWKEETRKFVLPLQNEWGMNKTIIRHKRKELE